MLSRYISHPARLLGVAVVVAAALAAGAPSALAYGDNLLQGQSLFSGYPGADRIVSHNRLYTVIMQCDGNLVEYGPGRAVWNTRTGGHSCAAPQSGLHYTLEMQSGDGNLVVYDHSSYTDFPSTPERSHYLALWDSHTYEQGNPSKFLYVRDDGHLVIERNQPPVGVVWDNTWNSGAVPTFNVGYYLGGLFATSTPDVAGSTPRSLHVAALAESYNGQTEIPATFARQYWIGPHWSGYCESFVALIAWGGGRYATAYEDYLAHRNAGLIHYGVPPRGAIVYWNPSNDGVGHVGISIGGGEEISTYGFVGQDYPIQVHLYTYFRNYLGWAMP